MLPKKGLREGREERAVGDLMEREFRISNGGGECYLQPREKN